MEQRRPRRLVRKFLDHVLMTDAELAQGRLLETAAEQKEVEWRAARADVENYYDQFPTMPNWDMLLRQLESVLPKDLLDQFRQRAQASMPPDKSP